MIFSSIDWDKWDAESQHPLILNPPVDDPEYRTAWMAGYAEGYRIALEDAMHIVAHKSSVAQ